MRKVTIDTARSLQKKHKATDGYIPLVFEGKEYVQIIDMDTVSCDGDDFYWEATAVCLGDEIDSEGYAPVYSLIWVIDHPEAEDGADTVDDWETLDDVKNIGEINVDNGRIC